jgi:uncharacterized Fe-S cluster-containing radical SAM superfamily protein
MKYKTCKHLEGNLYLAPNEIRACCQRFFHKGKMRGDAVLLKTSKGQKISSGDILKAREKMFQNIQNDKEEACLGCNYIVENEKPKITKESNFLSIEHHSFCNLKCTYCSEIYYGGKKPDYDVVDFLNVYGKEGNLKKCSQVVWGGGEPTLDKNFKKMLLDINKIASPKIYHRVFTNSVIFKDSIKEFLDEELIKVVTSLDAGTPETFKKIRGKDKFIDVFKNLNKYSEKNPGRVTVKYILTEGNSSDHELEQFVENCIKYNLDQCCYQISMNYKFEDLSFDNFKAAIYLFSKLISNKVKKVFIDDHILARFSQLGENEIEKLKKFLKMKKIENVIFDSEKINSIVIFGAGQLSKELINKAKFFKNAKFDIVDSSKAKIGKIFNGKVIKDPVILKNDKRPIYISAAQSYDSIFSYLNTLNKTDDIISGIFI